MPGARLTGASVAVPVRGAGDEDLVGDRVEDHADVFTARVAALAGGGAFHVHAAEHDVEADATAVGGAVFDAVHVVGAGVLGVDERLVGGRADGQLHRGGDGHRHGREQDERGEESA